MAHFALIDDSNTVTDVIVVSNDTLGNLPFPESEPIGQEFIASLGLDGDWLQTSYNGTFRGEYAGIGYLYDEELDIFVAIELATDGPIGVIVPTDTLGPAGANGDMGYDQNSTNYGIA